MIKEKEQNNGKTSEAFFAAFFEAIIGGCLGYYFDNSNIAVAVGSGLGGLFAYFAFKYYTTELIQNVLAFLIVIGPIVILGKTCDHFKKYDEKYDEWYIQENRQIVVKEGKYGFIDSLDNLVVPVLYDKVNSFTLGHTIVNLNGGYFVIDSVGRRVSEDYDYIQDFDLVHKITRVERFGKVGIIAINGVELIPPIYDDILSFSENVFWVKKGGQFGFVNIDNPYKFNGEFQYEKCPNSLLKSDSICILCTGMYEFVKNVAVVKNKNGFYLINKNGESLTPNFFFQEVGTLGYHIKKAPQFTTCKGMPWAVSFVDLNHQTLPVKIENEWKLINLSTLKIISSEKNLPIIYDTIVSEADLIPHIYNKGILRNNTWKIGD